MQITSLDLLATEGWDRFVSRCPQATLFHTSAWQRALARSCPHRPCCLQAETTGRVIGILPLHLVRSLPLGRLLCSVPMGNYGGVCADSPDIAAALLSCAHALGQQTGARFVELRNLSPSQALLPTKTAFSTAILKLCSDSDRVWRNSLRAQTRNQVRKARKAGLTVEWGPECLRPFHRVFLRNMRDLGTPAYNSSFLKIIAEEFGCKAEFYCVLRSDRVIGGLVTIAFKDTLYVPWASSLREYFDLCPNNRLYWTVIARACRRGYQWFDFGRSLKGSGPMTFKLQWGAREHPLHYQYLLPPGASPPTLDLTNSRAVLATRLWRRLPLTVTRALGHWALAQVA